MLPRQSVSAPKIAATALKNELGIVNEAVSLR